MKQSKDDLSDSELLLLSGKGDENAFLALYRRHHPAIFRFALHMSGRREIAEEVTQEVFMTLLSGRKLYSVERGALQGYLIGIARNKVRRLLEQDRKTRPDSTALPKQASMLEGVNKEEELRVLHNAILSLPANYREVVVLCDLENADYAQTARQLGCAVGTVRSRLHRARVILGMKLRKGQGCSA